MGAITFKPVGYGYGYGYGYGDTKDESKRLGGLSIGRKG